MEIENLEQILTRRKEIEQELLEILKETKSDFSLKDVKNVIYNEKEQDDLTKAIAMLDDGNPENLSNVLEILNDAWNYFPHKIIGDVSPAEKILEYRQKQS